MEQKKVCAGLEVTNGPKNNINYHLTSYECITYNSDMITINKEGEALLNKMKTIATKIQAVKLKRQAYTAGVEAEFVSMNEQKKLEREFATIARKHKKLFFSK